MMRNAASYLAPAIAALCLAGAALAQGNVTDAARQRYENANKEANIQDVARSMESGDPMERLDGLREIKSLEDQQAVDLLLQALGDNDMRVRAKAIDSCGDLRATPATPVLIQQLFMSNTEPVVQRRILAALGKIGDVSAAQPIMDLLDQDLDTRTRGTAIYALGDLGSPDSLTLLDGIAEREQNKTIQRLASQAAAKVRHAQSLRASEVNQPLNTFLRPAEPPQ